MGLVLLHHAVASSADPQAALSAQGREQARAIGQRLRWYDCHAKRILCGPSPAARETAAIVAAVLDCAVAIELDTALALSAAPAAHAALAAQLAPELSGLAIDGRTLVIGDQSVARVLALLVPSVQPQLGDAPLAHAEAVRVYAQQVRWRFRYDDAAPARIDARLAA